MLAALTGSAAGAAVAAGAGAAGAVIAVSAGLGACAGAVTISAGFGSGAVAVVPMEGAAVLAASGTAAVVSILKSLGVGALYLGSAATPFELRTADNTALGTVRASGISLNEDHSVGTLQQVDLVV